MPDSSDKEKIISDANDNKPPRVKGIGNPESRSQDADRHRKREHQKSEK